MPRHKQGMECLCSSTTFRAWRYVEHVALMALGWTARLFDAVLALRTATLPSAAAAARSRPVRRLLDVPDLGNGVSTCRCASGDGAARDAAPASWRRWSLYGVSGARQPCGPVDRPTAKDGGEMGKAVCGPRPGTPVDAEVDLDVVWMPGGLL